MSCFDFDEEGHSIVVADGAEVLVYDGRTEGPRWRADTGAPLVGVGTTAVVIVSLDASGTLRLWSHEQATTVRTVDLGVAPTALVHDFGGHVGALHADGVVVLDGTAPPRRIAVAGATAAAFGDDGVLLVGARDGGLQLFDASGARRGAAEIPKAVTAIAWNSGGFFVVASAESLYRIEGVEQLKGAHITRLPDVDPIRAVACSPEGDRIAAQAGDRLVAVMSYPGREPVGSAEYPERTICGIAFGPAPWLGIGLTGGDANKANLASGALHRTDPHPGRPLNRWLVMNGFKHNAAPPAAPAPAQAPTSTPVQAPRSTPATSARPAAGPSRGLVAVVVALVALGVIGVLAVIVAVAAIALLN